MSIRAGGEDACAHCDEPIYLMLGADFVVWVHTETVQTRCNREPGPGHDPSDAEREESRCLRR